MNLDFLERRQIQRVTCDLPAEVRLGSGGFLSARAIDLSAQGAHLSIDLPPRPGTECSVTVNWLREAGDLREIAFDGIVRYQLVSGRYMGSEIGVEFSFVHPQSKIWLELFIARNTVQW